MKRFSLSSNERIKKRSEFEYIFSNGKSIYSSGKLLYAVFTVEKEAASPGVKITAAVGKKLGNAVWRNRVKRLIKESYRLNKEILTETCFKNNFLLKIIFSPGIINKEKNRILSYRDVMPHVVEILKKIAGRL